MARPKKIQTANGQHLAPAKKPVTAADISKIFGDNGLARFGTLNLEDFESKIKSMQPSELFNFAAEQGIRGGDLTDKQERDRLISTLMTEFKAYSSQFSLGKQQPPKAIKPDSAAQISKLINQGF